MLALLPEVDTDATSDTASDEDSPRTRGADLGRQGARATGLERALTRGATAVEHAMLGGVAALAGPASSALVELHVRESEAQVAR